ncbi:MAG: hypothetical protein EP330_26370 [Deltaproteobacteria bacterium]|nr:MAG: hypothetical protein EP330_26370 [Deltaproteobacteria bacterium]
MRAGLWLLLLLPLAEAHRPAGDIGDVEITDATISWLIPGTFETGDEVFVVELVMPTDFALPFEVLVEKRPRLADHRPMYAVVGPGLPTPTADELAVLPYPLPDGWGVYLDQNDLPERIVYFEQVMRRNMWTSGTTALPLQRGPNEVWIWSPDGTTGDFQLGFGVEEDFSDGGFGAVFADWGTYAY